MADSHEDFELDMAKWILGRDPFKEEILTSSANKHETTDMPVHDYCPTCQKKIYEKYYNGSTEDFLAGREICSVCKAGCIKFIVYVHNTDEPATQDTNGKCCRCGNNVLVDL